MPSHKNIKNKKQYRSLAQLIVIPMILVSSPIVGYIIGYGIDILFKTDPYFSIIFLFLGFAAGVKETIKTVKRFEKESEAINNDNQK